MWFSLCAALALVASTYAAPQPVNDDGFTPLKVITEANHLAKRDGHILPLFQVWDTGLSDYQMFGGIDVTVGGQTFRLLFGKQPRGNAEPATAHYVHTHRLRRK